MSKSSMSTKKEEKHYTTLDAYRAGYLKTKGHEPVLVEEDDKVVFVFSFTEQLQEDIRNYENGASTDALRFSMAIKALKTEIHALRREKRNEK
jgi:hypothetical protein